MYAHTSILGAVVGSCVKGVNVRVSAAYMLMYSGMHAPASVCVQVRAMGSVSGR